MNYIKANNKFTVGGIFAHLDLHLQFTLDLVFDKSLRLRIHTAMSKCNFESSKYSIPFLLVPNDASKFRAKMFLSLFSMIAFVNSRGFFFHTSSYESQ